LQSPGALAHKAGGPSASSPRTGNQLAGRNSNSSRVPRRMPASVRASGSRKRWCGACRPTCLNKILRAAASTTLRPSKPDTNHHHETHAEAGPQGVALYRYCDATGGPTTVSLSLPDEDARGSPPAQSRQGARYQEGATRDRAAAPARSERCWATTIAPLAAINHAGDAITAR
jgi:hypothetical protein